MPWLSNARTRLFYQDTGQNTGTQAAVMLMAGMTSDSSSWDILMPGLAPKFRVIRPDNRGVGQTQGGAVTLDAWINDGLALIDHLQLDNVHVVGHSMGGRIAAGMAAKNPGCIASLSLLASGPLALARNVELFRTLAALRSPDQPADLWLRAFFPWLFHPDFFERPDAVQDAITAAQAYPYAQTLDGFTAQIGVMAGARGPWPQPDLPLQAILGENDLMLPTDMMAQALDHLKPAAIHIIPRAGHAVHWDAPNAVLTPLIEFITST